MKEKVSPKYPANDVESALIYLAEGHITRVENHFSTTLSSLDFWEQKS